ncbi:MAG: cytochrome P450 [Comamonadaceae bacterium]|nr:cytochrome P450 [Comamonadaceae bacterium]
MLDIDPADRADFIAWSDDIAAFIGSPQPTLDLALRAQSSSIALSDYFRSLLPLRRNSPGDDLISQLIRAQGEGRVITEKELVAQCAMLLFAGHETTRNLLGNGLYWLLRHRDQWTRLRDDPQLMPAAVREMLRFDSPIQYTARRISADVQMHGRTLKRGQLLVPLIGAANRDPARFSDPDRFDIGRDEGMHLSFGHGPHVCVGAALTTMEADIAFSTLMRRLPMLELASPVPDWSGNPVYRGLAALPLRTNRRSAASRAIRRRMRITRTTRR